ncbi:MAG: S9 family peptidase [Novosphingobium sp.]|nr:S9 family peptidase [Novosphingobium sp.]
MKMLSWATGVVATVVLSAIAAHAQAAAPIQAGGVPPADTAAATVIAPSGAKASSGGQLPVSAFARLPFIEGAKLSPDGEMIAGQFAVNGEQRFVVASLFEAGRKFQAPLPDGVEVDRVLWVGNDNVVLSVRAIRPITLGENFYVSRLIAFNRATAKFTRLLDDLGGQHASDILWIPTDGTTEILVAGQNSIFQNEGFWPSVYMVDVVTGANRKVAGPTADVMDWIADPQGVVRAKVAVDRVRGRRTLLYRTLGNAGYANVGSAAFDALEVPVLFTPGEAKAVVSRTTNDGTDALVEINPETHVALRTLFQAPAGRAIDSVRFDDSGNAVLGVMLDNEIAGGLHWIDPALAELQEAFEKSLKGSRGRIISLSADRRKMLVQIDRADDPGRLYYFDRSDGTLRSFAYINQDITVNTSAKVSTVRYKARDGLEIEAILTMPRDREAKALPVVVMTHGGPWSHDTPTWDYWAQFVASRGYLVIQPNFRGSTGYGTDFLRKGQGQMGFAMQDDVNDALDWAVKHGMADPGRACLLGASYGGYVAMWGAARDPDMWRCTISLAGVANLRREVNDFGDQFYGKRYREQWEKMTPDFAAVSPIRFVDRIKAPMLLIHGKKDLTVDHAQSKSMNAKMIEAGKTVEFLSLPKADHYFSREADRVALLAAIERFLARHNPAD